MGHRLFGVETEYALNGMKGRREVDRGTLVHQLLEVGSRSLVHLPDLSSSGMFLENGARLYLDCGLHQEYATPECSNPWDVVRHIEAGHRTMLNLISSIPLAKVADTEIGCYRINVDYSGTGSTWGCHESYLHGASPENLPAQLIPHLVTRVIFTGAGGFAPLSPGLRFTLSPRASHIRQVISRESTCERGIYHTKNEPLCKGYNRLHVLCGESLCSHLAMFLKIGTTSLVVAMAEAGLHPGNDVQLASPLEALQTVADDVECRQRLPLDGLRSKTAIEIQRHYLEMAEAHAGLSFMPPWAPEVCARWRAVLDRLEEGPEAVSEVLDWGIKLSLYSDRAARRGLDWALLPFWTGVVTRLNAALESTGYREKRVSVAFAIGPQSPIPAVAAELSALLESKGLDESGLKRFLDLRSEFLEIDTRFGQLGPRGIFNTLDEAGVLQHRVDGVDNIEHAMVNPPIGARARLRGDAIKRLGPPVPSKDRSDWRCDWNVIFSEQHGKTLDLSDPFAQEERWREDRGAEDSDIDSSRLHRLLAGLLERR